MPPASEIRAAEKRLPRERCVSPARPEDTPETPLLLRKVQRCFGGSAAPAVRSKMALGLHAKVALRAEERACEVGVRRTCQLFAACRCPECSVYSNGAFVVMRLAARP